MQYINKLFRFAKVDYRGAAAPKNKNFSDLMFFANPVPL